MNVKLPMCRLGALSGAIVAAVVTVPAATAQVPDGTTYDSFDRAYAVLEAGLQAIGGAAAISAIDNLTLEQTRTLYRRGQERRPGAAAYETGGVRMILDIAQQRGTAESWLYVLDGYPVRSRVVADVAAGRSFTAQLTWDGVGAVTRSDAATAQATWTTWNRLLPHLVLSQAAARPAALRYLAQQADEGIVRDVITFGDAQGTQITLFFDAETNLLTRLETIGFNPVFGDVLSAVEFSDFDMIAGVLMPRRARHWQSGILVDDVFYTSIAVNTGIVEAVFEVPTGFTDAAGSASIPSVVRIADGVYLGQPTAGYRSLFVEMDDHVVVVEAAFDSDSGTRLIELVREAVPDKPIRYVVPTHHHWDHIGGLRPFIAAGVTIVTTDGNTEVIERLAASRRLASTDTLDRQPRPPVIETFSGERVFGSGARTLRIIDVGPTRHADEIIVAYLPAECLVFQGDLLFVGEEEYRTRILVGDGSRALHRGIEQHGMDVRRIYGVHGRAATLEQLVRSSAAAQDGWYVVLDAAMQPTPNESRCT